MEEFNLHLTGDIHAVSIANNLLAAAIDARIQHEAQADERWPSTGLPRAGHRPRHDHLAARGGRQRRARCGSSRRAWATTGWTARGARPASTSPSPAEVMAILALATDLKDMRQRLGRIVIGMNRKGDPVTAEDLGVRRRDDGADEGRHQAQPDADARRPARVRPRRPVRQHRPRQQLDHRRPDRAEAGRLRGHRERLRRGHRHGEVLRHQVPHQRAAAQLRGAGRHDPRAEDARRRARRSRPASPCRRATPRRTSTCWRRARATWRGTSRSPGCSACRWWWPSTSSRRTPPAELELARKAAEAAGAEAAVVGQPLGRGRRGRGRPGRGRRRRVREARRTSSCSTRTSMSIKEKIETICHEGLPAPAA